MILAIDAGNTRAKWKVWRDGNAYGSGFFDYAHSELNLKNIQRDYNISRIFLAEVGSAGLALLLTQVFNGDDVYICSSQKQLLEITNSYEQPQRLGVDRFLAFAEAYHLAGKKAVAVLDFGTAATFDAVDNSGLHLGGHIVPGLYLLQTALQMQTDQVHVVPSLGLDGAWGKNTQQAVEQGTAAMLLAWAKQEIKLFRRRFCGADIYITGGLGAKLSKLLADENVILHQDLVLDAMKRLADDEN